MGLSVSVKALPFDVKVPNAVTARTLRKADRGRGFSSIQKCRRSIRQTRDLMRTPYIPGSFAATPAEGLSKLCDVLTLLIAAEPLPPRLKDHPLTGDWGGYRDCHIEPDWLLLYKIDGNDLILGRTVAYAELFR